MKSFLLLLLLPTFISAQSWYQLSDFPGTARDDGSSFRIDSTVYCGLGLEVGWTCTNDFHAFDLATETWASAPAFPSNNQRQYACGFSSKGYGYIFGGVDCSNTFLNDLWEFNKSTGNWIQKTSLPSNGRSGSVVFTINDSVYVVGGKNSSTNALAEVWVYHPMTDTWLQKPNLPFNGLWRGVAYSYNDSGLIGLGKNNLEHYNRDFYVFEQSTNSWNVVPSLHHSGRAYSGFSQIDSLGYLFGGADTLGNISTEFEKIDLKNFTYTSLASFPATARKGCMTFAFNDAYYLTTGVSTTARYNETWKAVQIVGEEELSIPKQFVLYPNPNSGSFNLQSNIDIKHITITNLLGETVYHKKVNNNFVSLDVLLNSGIYYLQAMTTTQRQFLQKLIIQ